MFRNIRLKQKQCISKYIGEVFRAWNNIICLAQAWTCLERDWNMNGPIMKFHVWNMAGIRLEFNASNMAETCLYLYRAHCMKHGLDHVWSKQGWNMLGLCMELHAWNMAETCLDSMDIHVRNMAGTCLVPSMLGTSIEYNALNMVGTCLV